MKITFSDTIGSTPAIVRRDTGEIFLNAKIWFTLPQAYRRFIFFHEVGHYAQQTTNELEADHFAFNQIAGTAPESLKNTVRTLSEVLPFNTELQAIRLQNMYRLALTYDQLKQPTAARLAEIRRIEANLKNYKLNEQLQQYKMYSQKGKPTDYEFPGYDTQMFQPSVGNWFRDIPINSSAALIKPWPSGTPKFQPASMAQNQPLTIQIETMPGYPANNTVINTANAVPLSAIPEFKVPKGIDFKSVAIGVLIILALIGLNKL